MDTPFLLIGFGNTLRGDDGAGPRLAEKVMAWNSPHVRVLIRQALVPELAEDLHQAERVLFVDACHGIQQIQVLSVTPSSERIGSVTVGHNCDPAGLLTLAQSVYGRCPKAYLLLLPAESFSMGEELSAVASAGIEAAVIWIRDWVGE